MIELRIDASELRPLIRQIVAEALAAIDERFPADGRIAYSEGEAAALLGVARHVLRDSRLRGDIEAKRIGKGWRYSRPALLEFVGGNR